MHRNLVDVLQNHARRCPEQVAAIQMREGRPHPYTWLQLWEDVQQWAVAFSQWGLEDGQRVAIWAETSYQWVVCDLGIALAGGISVPLYPTTSAKDAQAIFNDAQCTLLLVEGKTDFENAQRIGFKTLGIQSVVWTGKSSECPDGAVPAAMFLDAHQHRSWDVEGHLKQLDRASIYSLIYTSGTTGQPKGVMTTHGAMLHVAEAVDKVELVRPADTQFMFLPLAHAFARSLMVSWLVTRHTVAFPESRQSYEKALRVIRPTVVCGVPLFFQRLIDGIWQKAQAKGKWLADFSDRSIHAISQPGKYRGAWAKMSVAPVLGWALRRALGGNIRLLVSGGAHLDPMLAHLFSACGVELLEGYGLTESAAASFVNRPGHNRIGTVGYPLPGTAFKLAADREILIRSPSVTAGYWVADGNSKQRTSPELSKGDDEQATNDCHLVDGWLHTGDLGSIDDSGALVIDGRKKTILVTSSGRNVAPEKIERLLHTEVAIERAWVIGDRRPFLVAMLTLDEAWMKHIQPNAKMAYATLSQSTEVREHTEAVIARVNARLSSYERIRAFGILGQRFSIDAGNLTPTGKLRRKRLSERYQEQIERLYAGAD